MSTLSTLGVVNTFSKLTGFMIAGLLDIFS